MTDLTFTLSIPVVVTVAILIWRVWVQDNDLKKMSAKYNKEQRKAEDRLLVLETEFKTHNEHYDDLKESIDKIFDRLNTLAGEIRNGKP